MPAFNLTGLVLQCEGEYGVALLQSIFAVCLGRGECAIDNVEGL
jgi:hypothetical protein